jgi:hypothetical protein
MSPAAAIVLTSALLLPRISPMLSAPRFTGAFPPAGRIALI